MHLESFIPWKNVNNQHEKCCLHFIYFYLLNYKHKISPHSEKVHGSSHVDESSKYITFYLKKKHSERFFS